MRRRLLFSIGLTVFLLFQPLFARQGETSDDGLARVTFVPLQQVTVSAGHPVTVQFKFHIPEGYFIGSDQPSTAELTRASLGIFPPQDVIIAEVRYPAGQPLAASFDKAGEASVYSGELTIQAEIIAQRKAVPGNYTVHGEFRFQPCDRHAAYPPQKLAVKFDLKVAAVRGSPKPGRIS